MNPITPGAANSEPPISDKALNFLLAEHAALREEIVKRVDIQHQLISLSVLVAGTFYSVGLQPNSSTMPLIYPFLAMFLAAAWFHNELLVIQIGGYIRYRIEPTFQVLGWDLILPTLAADRRTPLGLLDVFAARGILVGSQTLAIFISLIASSLQIDTTRLILMVLDILVILITILLLRRYQPLSKERYTMAMGIAKSRLNDPNDRAQVSG